MSHHVDPYKRKTVPEKARCERTGKVIFKRHQDAMKVIGMQRSRNVDVQQWPKSAYRCEHCSRWHISSFTPAMTKWLKQAKKHQQTQRRGGPKP